MEFINFEAIDSDQELQENFEEENILSENGNFINDKSVKGDTTQPSFMDSLTRPVIRKRLYIVMIFFLLIIEICSLKCTSVNLEKMLNLITLKTVPSYLRNSERVSARLRMWTKWILFLTLFYLDF